MRFDQLNQSIELNAEESPSLYNTLNMIRSLFQDVEDAADAPLSQCPVGDSKLPLEMIWLSKELIGIYQDNSDELQRNRARLDSVMEKLAATQTELEGLAQVEKLLPGKQAEYQALEQKLSAARLEQAAYEKLLADTKAAQEELSLLQRFDMDAANQKLQNLQTQIRELEDQIRDLDTRMQTLTGDKTRQETALSDQRNGLLTLQETLARLSEEQKTLLSRKEQAEKLRDELEAAISEARTRVTELEDWNKAASQTSQELETQVQQLTGDKNQLAEQVNRLRKTIEELSGDIASLRKEYDQILLPERQRLSGLKQQLLDEKARIQREIEALTGETKSLEAELLALRGTLSQRLQERDNARKAVEDYRRDVLNPILTERDALLATQQQLQADKAAADQEITQLTTNKRALILEIGRKKDQLERDNREYETHINREKELAQEQEQLTVRKNAALDALALRQTEYEKLKNEDLPAAEKFLADETLRRDTLLKKVDDTKTQCQEITNESQRMNSELPTLREKLRNLQINYDALTVTYNASNSDIVELERKIRELEQKNDQERMAQYRAQQTEKKQQLEQLAEECAALEAEIVVLGQKVEAETAKRLSLENRKDTQEKGLIGIEQMLQELRPWADPEKIREAENTQKRFDCLKEVRDSLANSITTASKQIASYELNPGELRILDLETYLKEASACSRDLYRDLSRCAKTLENYYMEEPK